MKQEELNLTVEHEDLYIEKEPLLWIKELRIYKDYSTQEVLRKIVLHKGCNILWSAPSDSEDLKLYDSGLSGHAAGKTTFCRLLRYILGEKTYGNEHLQERIDQHFISGRVAAEVVIQQTTWLVSLPLGCGDEAFCTKGACLDELFSKDLEKETIKTYHNELRNTLTGSLPSDFTGGRSIDWKNILPVLSRDQECRYSSLLNFRHAESKSSTASMSAEDKIVVLKALCDFIDDKETTLATELESLRDELSEIPKEIEKLEIEQNLLRQLLFEGMETPPADECLFFHQEQKRLKKDLSEIQEQIQQQGVSAKNLEAQKQFVLLRDEYKREEYEYQQRKQDLKQDIEEYEILCGKEHKKNREVYRAKHDKPRGRCNTPLNVAYASGCTCIEGSLIDFETEVSLKNGLAELGKQRKEWIDQESKDLEILLTSLNQQKTFVDSAEESYRRALYEDRMADWKLFKEEDQLQRQLKNLTKALQFYEQKKSALDRQEKLEGQINNKEKILASLRALHKAKLSVLKAVYTDILQAVIGNEVTSELAFHVNRVHAEVIRNGIRRSAALDTIKLLAFDLAMMKYSIQGKGHHPRFLIHDSPREADLAKDIYGRFLIYASEKMMPPDIEPSYQYIITTTEPPPQELIDKGYVLNPILNASIAKKRLLKIDL